MLTLASAMARRIIAFITLPPFEVTGPNQKGRSRYQQAGKLLQVFLFDFDFPVVVVVLPKAPPFWEFETVPLACVPDVLIVEAVVPALTAELPDVPALPSELLFAATFVLPAPPGPEVVVETELTDEVAPAVATVLVETEATPPFPLETTVLVCARAGAAIAATAVAVRRTLNMSASFSDEVR
ncbi:hypothetical protein [Caulobacter sp. S45]|jgi:hypothetical protein|uniref:hypothetical protein n=1 Tax=Caulobacter sp. S45 TaxID=1641861 RepID=UPI00131B7C2C|nr:hypothetical protein [Caulobacter sp. S45]